jgi:hypothetical protein
MAQDKGQVPTELNDVYEALKEDVSWLHAKWNVFKQLYATSEETVELLNDSAPVFFRICQDVLADDILLTISRLNDPYRTFGKDNLSMERLAAYVDGSKYPDLKAAIEILLVEAQDKCGFARELRNRRIAHSDLTTRLEAEANPLPVAHKQQINDALSALQAVLNKIEMYFEDNTVLYEQAIIAGGGETLVARLRDARTYRRQRRDILNG